MYEFGIVATVLGGLAAVWVVKLREGSSLPLLTARRPMYHPVPPPRVDPMTGQETRELPAPVLDPQTGRQMFERVYGFLVWWLLPTIIVVILLSVLHYAGMARDAG